MTRCNTCRSSSDYRLVIADYAPTCITPGLSHALPVSPQVCHTHYLYRPRSVTHTTCIAPGLSHTLSVSPQVCHTHTTCITPVCHTQSTNCPCETGPQTTNPHLLLFYPLYKEEQHWTEWKEAHSQKSSGAPKRHCCKQ